MDLCHLKNSELEPQFQKYNGRVVLRGDIVKDDSRSYAVYTEKKIISISNDSSKVMDIISSFQDVQDTQQTQYPLKHRSKWKMHQSY